QDRNRVLGRELDAADRADRVEPGVFLPDVGLVRGARVAHEPDGLPDLQARRQIDVATLASGKVYEEPAARDGKGPVENVLYVAARRRQPQMMPALAGATVERAYPAVAVVEVAHVLEPHQVEQLALGLLDVGVRVGDAADAREEPAGARAEQRVRRLER